jgi:hypothetical protein
MLNPEIEKPLSRIEGQVDLVCAAVVNGDPVSLESASLALRQAAVDFSGLLQEFAPDVRADRELKRRLKKVATGLSIHREGLIRRTVAVERSLHAMVPATRKSTYTQAMTGSYAGTARQTGAFKLLSA